MPIYQPQRGTYDAFYEDQENIEKIADQLKKHKMNTNNTTPVAINASRCKSVA